MKNSKPPMNRQVRALLFLCQEVATFHGIPLEVAVVRLISLGAAMAGDLIRFNAGDGQQRNARLSLMLIAGDAAVPFHFTAETEELFRRQSQLVGKTASQVEHADLSRQLRRRLRVRAHFEPTSGFGAKLMKGLIELNKRRRSLGAFTTVTTPPGSVGKPQRTSLVVDSAKALKTVLKSASEDDGWWKVLVTGEESMELLACVPERQWRGLTRQPNAEGVLGRVWTVSCPLSTYNPATELQIKLLCGEAFKRLEYARLGSVRFRFIPPDEARELLDHSVEQFRATDAELQSLNGHDTPLPDTHLAWKFSGILTALCCDGTGNELEDSFLQCAQLGSAMASWVLSQHTHHLRTSFPRLQGHELAPVDRRVLRALTTRPTTVRTIQRRLKQVSKPACLDSLGRLTDAKLAVEAASGHFAAPEEPGRSHELSTFLSTFDPNQIFPLRPDPRATDSTDNAATNPSPSITSKQGGEAGI